MEWNFGCFMKKRIDKITQKDMGIWQGKKKLGKLREGKREQYRDGQPSALATINRAVGVLSATINKAVERKLIEVNQIRGRRKLKTPRTASKFMTDEEIVNLYNVLNKQKGYFPVLVRLLLNAGLRPKEAIPQTWETGGG